MEINEINIVKLKDKIRVKKANIGNIKYKLDNETNDYMYELLEKDYKDAGKELNDLLLELNKTIEADKKEKLAYKKALTKVKDSLNEFYKETRTNTKIKKHLMEINNAIVSIDKYLAS
jgi:uncharacterized UPF0160 family protein